MQRWIGQPILRCMYFRICFFALFMLCSSAHGQDLELALRKERFIKSLRAYRLSLV
jgi:hypothetical protein